MHFSTLNALTLTLLTGAVLAVPHYSPPHHPPPPPPPPKPKVSIVHSFPLGHWIENIISRPCGDVLATQLLPSDQIYNVDPSTGSAIVVSKSVPGINGFTGITNGPEPDIYYIVGLNITTVGGFTPVPGTNSIYELDLRLYRGKPIELTKVLPLPHAQTLNGIAPVNPSKGIYLATDSLAGLIWRLDVHKRTSSVFLNNSWTGQPDAGPIGSAGPNGLKVFDNHAYWSLNNALSSIVRIPFNSEGYAIGDVAQNVTGTFTDDFAIDAKGDLYVTEAHQNEIAFVKAGQKGAVVIGTGIVGGTSVTIGKERFANSVFVSTAGNQTAYFTGVGESAGTVTRIEF